MAKSKLAEVVENDTPTPEVKVENTNIQEVIQPKQEAKSDMTFDERLLQFVKGKTQHVRINEFLKMEFKYAAGMQLTNKQLRTTLQAMVDSGKIEVKDDAHKELGKNFWLNGEPMTQHKTVLNTVLEVISK
jgi:hypothetical protein